MPDSFLTFQKFNDPELAEAMAAQLKAAGIESLIENETTILDSTFAGSDLGPRVQLKIAPKNFTSAYNALEAFYQAQLPALDPDYYLFSFTDTELMEIIQKPDEWGALDYVLAKKMLAEKGHTVTPALAEEFRESRLAELARPEPTHPNQIIAGYLFAFTGGFLGMIIGYVLAYLKKTLPNGQRVYVYPPAERRHGRRILIISIISFPFWTWRLVRGEAIFPWLFP